MHDWRLALRTLVPAGILIALAGGAPSAQGVAPPSERPSLAGVRQRVPLGASVVVLERSGSTVKGTLAAISDDVLELVVVGDRRRFAADAIERVQWQYADSLLNGALIGAALGAIPGIYWLAADPNECSGLCPEDYVVIAGGALVGALVDRAIHGRMTVYSAGGAGGRLRIMIVPSLRAGGALQLSLRF